MSYRVYLAYIEKEKLKNIDKELTKHKYNLFKQGKGIDWGNDEVLKAPYDLVYNIIELNDISCIKKENKICIFNNKEINDYYTSRYEFKIIKPEALIDIIKYTQNEVQSYQSTLYAASIILKILTCKDNENYKDWNKARGLMFNNGYNHIKWDIMDLNKPLKEIFILNDNIIDKAIKDLNDNITFYFKEELYDLDSENYGLANTDLEAPLVLTNSSKKQNHILELNHIMKLFKTEDYKDYELVIYGY